MDEEEEDKELLNTLGVTSANPEDIERDILEKATKDGRDGTQAAGGIEEETFYGTKNNETSSSIHGKLVNKLRAVELEIDAVTAAVEQFKNCKRGEDHSSDGDERSELGEEVERNGFQSSSNDLALQHALASDRLRTLKNTRAEIKKEISDSSTNRENNRLIRSLIKEEPKSNRRLKEVDKTTQNKKKRVKKVSFSEDDDFDAVLNAASAGFVETKRDELIRKGVLTPFHKLQGYERRIQEPGPSAKQVVSEDAVEHNDIASSSISRAVKSMSDAVQARPTTKLLDRESVPRIDAPSLPFQRLKKPLKIPRSLDLEFENKGTKRKKRRPQPGKKWKRLASREGNLQECDEKFPEEGDWKTSSDEDGNHEDTADMDGEGAPFVTLEGGLKIPETIFNNLFDYQKVGVQWLWELHCQRAGGIIGDEMGLGKTIQVLSFLGSLHFSGMYAPSIIICPVTLLRQWKREAKKWYPQFHVEMLHDSAQDGRKKRSSSNDSDHDSEYSVDSDDEEKSTKDIKKWDSLIKRVLRSESGLLITTYEQLRLHGDKLLDIEWGYAVLDEGHRIRNPNAEVTLVCKQLQTVHRIIMTGAPIQNKLSELWSLFDFVFPGKLGVLPVFEAEFAVPISVGGYANATPLQVSTAYRCAVVLRDLIMPYLLRRMKVDVEAHLPKKTEHVLFCSLTPEQRTVYRAFLASSEVEEIFDGNRNSLSGIDVMRKICNHPDLLEREHCHGNPDYGNPKRSGKMKVVSEVLKVWKEQGHRVLLFAQTQQMLDIIENFLIADGYSYRRMDGVTPVKQRMALIDEFNNTNDVFIFILTTKVGGLGTNLTGANRVIIFDPDWNPSTDMQARERAWRIGQKKDVIVYRLITRGTIEEKVYQRQIYKHFLTNKILKNPQQRRFFKARDMKDLFTLNDDTESGSTETSSIFSQLPPDVINVIGAHQDKKEEAKLTKPGTSDSDVSVTESECNPGLRNTGEDEANHVSTKADDETNFLQSLFESHGIHSAMNHDAIMNAHDEDKLKLEEHASKVAQRAAEALRHSRMLRSRESISVPTWTGKSGAAGAPSTVKRKFGSTTNSQLLSSSKPSEVVLNNDTTRLNGHAAGASSGKALSSAELLARIRGNQEKAIGDGLEHQFANSSSSNRAAGTSRPGNSSGMLPELVIRQMCTFIQRQGGRTSSARIVDHFKDKIPSKDLPLFKNLLKEIATLEKGPEGSHWVLKPEYRDH